MWPVFTIGLGKITSLWVTKAVMFWKYDHFLKTWPVFAIGFENMTSLEVENVGTVFSNIRARRIERDSDFKISPLVVHTIGR